MPLLQSIRYMEAFYLVQFQLYECFMYVIVNHCDHQLRPLLPFLGENIKLEKELFVKGKKKSAGSRINSLKVCFIYDFSAMTDLWKHYHSCNY